MSRYFRLGGLWLVPVTVLLVLLLSGCGSSPATSTGPEGGALQENDSVVEAQINAYRDSTKGFPKELEVRIIASQNVGDLMNPTMNRVDSVITAVTDEDVSKAVERFLGSFIIARIKQIDGGSNGILFYIYDIKAK